MSKLILIAAKSDNNVIGREGQVPWRIPEDLKRFKKLTMGHPVIMGRKTYESFTDSVRPLPGRINIIVSGSQQNYDGAIVCKSLEEALEKGKAKGDCYICGGDQIYHQTIDIADRLEITEVHRYIEGDAIFPYIDKNKWKETFREDNDDFSFVTYESLRPR